MQIPGPIPRALDCVVLGWAQVICSFDSHSPGRLCWDYTMNKWEWGGSWATLSHQELPLQVM